jgi:FlaA1/EpsC-like NDP-sugar epimerase
LNKQKIWDGIAKDLWIVLLDVIAVNASYFLALLIRFYVNGEFRATVNYLIGDWAKFAPFYTVLCILIFALFKLYGGMWRYAGINDMNRIIGASVCTAVLQVVGTALFIRRMPITYYLIGAILQFLFISLIRFGYRILLVEKKKVADRKTPTVPSAVIGAGETARKAIQHLEDTPFRATVVIDEQSAGKTLDGIIITSNLDKALTGVRAVFVADPNLTQEKRKEIREKCDAAGIELQDYTGYLNNLGGRIPVSSLLEMVKGSVTLVIEGREQTFVSGEEALKSLKDRYEIRSIEGAKVELTKPSSAAYVGYEAWAQQHKEQTGEDVSFF